MPARMFHSPTIHEITAVSLHKSTFFVYNFTIANPIL